MALLMIPAVSMRGGRGDLLNAARHRAGKPRPARTAAQVSKRGDGAGVTRVENSFKGPAPALGVLHPLRCSHTATQAWRWRGEVVQFRQLLQEFVHGARPRVGGGRWNGGITGCGTKLAEVAGRSVAERRPGAPGERGQGSRRPLGHRRSIVPRPSGPPEHAEPGLELACSGRSIIGRNQRDLDNRLQ